MTACTSFLAFFAEQTLAFAVKMHSRPDRWPQIVRFASGRADSLANRRFVNDQKRPRRIAKIRRGRFVLPAQSGYASMRESICVSWFKCPRSCRSISRNTAREFSSWVALASAE